MVAPRAIIRDMFPVKETARIFSLLILIIGISPIIAPTTGGYITAHFGWHSIFILLASILFLILMAVIFLLPESRKPDPGFSLRPKPILASFEKVITTPQFYTYAFAGATASAGLYAYLAGSPFCIYGPVPCYGTALRMDICTDRRGADYQQPDEHPFTQEIQQPANYTCRNQYTVHCSDHIGDWYDR